MASKFEDTSSKNISEAFEFLNKKPKRQGSNQYIPEAESEKSTEELVKSHEDRGHFDDKPGTEALKRHDLTKPQLKRLFAAGNVYRKAIQHPLVDKEMMKGFLDHAEKHFKNDLAQKAVAHKGEEMGVKHPLIDKMNTGELKPKVLDLGSGPSKDYGKGSGSWTGD